MHGASKWSILKELLNCTPPPPRRRAQDWHRHREVIGPRHLWRFIDRD
eukprot:COSAG05_NODE_1136_length_5755_cov_4.734441_1_plen_47_part_10